MNRGETMDEKRKFLESLLARYGAVPTDLDRKNRERYDDSVIHEYDNSFYWVGTAGYDGQEFLVLSCIDKRKYAELGLLEDMDVLAADSSDEQLEKSVRYALGVEPYPERYPEI